MIYCSILPTADAKLTQRFHGSIQTLSNFGHSKETSELIQKINKYFVNQINK
jgi:hypothetical protein